MPRKLEICKRPEWFLGLDEDASGKPGYPIYYRYVICYSIAQNINKIPDRNYKWLSQEMTNLIEAFDEKKLYISPDFLELYPLAEETGFALVDQSDSCYPLIIYAQRSVKEDKRSRVYAFGQSLKSINNNLEEIYRKLLDLADGQIWDENFQRELYKLVKP